MLGPVRGMGILILRDKSAPSGCVPARCEPGVTRGWKQAGFSVWDRAWIILGFPGGARAKELACQCRRRKRRRFDPWVGKIPWRRKWQPTPVFLPGESRGQRSLAGYSPWGHKELDVTEQLSTAQHMGYLRSNLWLLSFILLVTCLYFQLLRDLFLAIEGMRPVQRK